MFNRYTLNVRANLAPTDILDVNTNTDLIYVFDDVLPASVMNEINNFNYDQFNWNQRNNEVTAGGTARYDIKYNDPLRPGFLISSKKYILMNGLRKLSKTVDIDAVCLEFFIRSRNDGATGQVAHRDCQELGPIWTMLLHMIGNSGPTVFYENYNSDKIVASVDFKPGRVILFPSLYTHKGCLPESGDRFILNSVLRLKDFEYTEFIFDKNLDLKQKYLDKMLK
jgi:hypothetical protein